MSVIAFGQTTQSEFLEAKRLFREGDFKSAQSAFSSLYQDPSFGAYATFYAGLSSYELNEKSGAISIWRQILTNNPNWDQVPETYYWMIRSNYELGEFGEAIRLSQRLAAVGDVTTTEELANHYMPTADLAILKGLYDRHPDFAPLAQELVGRLVKEEPNEIETIQGLISKFDLDPEDFSQISKANVKKDEYAVAVLFPFLFDGLENPDRTMNNRVVMQLYQGMVSAQEALEKQGLNVRLYPFDTGRDADVTRQLLKEEGVKNADLILGPLFPGPNYVVDSFARAEQINMVNPVSTNSNVIGSNPFSFLLKPSNETMARELAIFAAEKYAKEDRGALIYYAQTDQDSTFAAEYKQQLEEQGMDIIQYRSVDIKGSKALLDSLIEKEDIFIENRHQLDTLREDPDRIIKSRKPKPQFPEERDYLLPTGRYEGDSSVYYEVKYTILQNSIGHIAVISRDNSIINSFIGVVETRADTIGLVGYGNWTELSAVDYDQLERLGVSLAMPEYLDKKSMGYNALYAQIKESCACLPTSYHIEGYEGLFFLGQMLHKHGKYFQKGWIADGMVPGKALQGYDFGLYRDNQVVPIVGLNNLELQPVSPSINDEE